MPTSRDPAPEQLPIYRNRTAAKRTRPIPAPKCRQRHTRSTACYMRHFRYETDKFWTLAPTYR